MNKSPTSASFCQLFVNIVAAVLKAGPPRNLSVEIVSGRYGVVRWEAPSWMTATVDHYILTYGRTGETARVKKRLRWRQFTTGFLSRGIEYEFSVAANVGGQIGEYANTTIKTPDARPTGPPRNVTLTTLTPTSVRVSWLPPLKLHQNGKIVEYKLTWQKENITVWSRFVYTHNTSEVVGGERDSLQPDTRYNIWLKAYTRAGSGPDTRRFSFRTSRGKCRGKPS
jgi:hypothetical protein